jgi:DNA polymerase I-like protein with 3'-5' exonuclease and polymerase domains
MSKTEKVTEDKPKKRKTSKPDKADLRVQQCLACPLLCNKIPDPTLPESLDILVISESSTRNCAHYIEDLFEETHSTLAVGHVYLVECGQATKEELKTASECCWGRKLDVLMDTKPKIVVTIGYPSFKTLEQTLGHSPKGINDFQPLPSRLDTERGSVTFWHINIPHFDIYRQLDRLKKDIPRLLEDKPVVYVPTDSGIEFVVTPEEIDPAFDWLEQQELAAIDWETTGLRPYNKTSKILSVAIGTFDRTFVFPVFHPQTPSDFDGNRVLDRVVQLLKKVPLVAHNASFELEQGEKFRPGFAYAGLMHDTMAQAAILYRPEKPKKLDALIRDEFGFSLKVISDVEVAKLESAPLEDVLWYNGRDTKWTLPLFFRQQEKIRAEGLEDLYMMQLTRIPSVVMMMNKGLIIDEDFVKKQSAELQKQFDDAEQNFYSLPELVQFSLEQGKLMNPASPVDTKLLFHKYCGVSESVTSFDAESLEEIDHPVGHALKAIRTITKLHSTYILPYNKYEDEGGEYLFDDGLVHTSFNTLRTVTFRLSSSNPNCFPAEVEVLTKHGFTPWDQVTDHDELAQYDQYTGSVDFSRPLKLHKYAYSGNLLHNYTDTFVSVVSTPDHRFLVSTDPKQSYKSLPASDLHQWLCVPQAGNYVGGTQHYTKEEITLITAIQADGSVVKRRNGLCLIDMSFSKERKVERLSAALDSIGILYQRKDTITVLKRANGADYELTRKRIRFYVPERYAIKRWGSFLLDWDKQSLETLAKEVWNWDGCASRQTQYCSKHKTDADWIQTIQVLTGHRSKVREYKREGRSYWIVDSQGNQHGWLSRLKQKEIPFTGEVFCATMPKDTLIIRHNNRVMVTNNCQNLPSRGGKKFYRNVFTAKSGHLLLPSDMAQIEYRMIATVSGDEEMIHAINNGLDVHMFWAKRLVELYTYLVKDPDDPKQMKEFRSMIKNQWTFPLCYGSSPYNIFKAIGLRPKDKDSFLKVIEKEFWDHHHGVKKWHERLAQELQSNGYITSPFGRKFRWPLSFNEMINYGIQSTAHDVVAEAMKELVKLAIELDIPDLIPVLEIHDDLTFMPQEDLIEELLPIIVEKMIDGRKYEWLKVPLEVEVNAGYSLGSCSLLGTFSSQNWEFVL